MSESAKRTELEAILPEVMEFQAPYLAEKLLLDGTFASRPAAEKAFTELKKYLWLTVALGKDLPMPSATIDETWHQFILFTQEYHAFCDRFFGRYLHHHPSLSKGPPTEEENRQAREFFRSYQQYFGRLPRIWIEQWDARTVIESLSDELAREALTP